MIFKKNFFLFVLFFISVVNVSLFTLHASSKNVATASALFLKMPVGGRPLGMGNAFTSITEDVNSLFWNPAGLVYSDTNEVMFTHNNYFHDVKHYYFAYTFLYERFNGQFGVNISYLDYGSFERTYILNELDHQSAGNFSANDFSIGFSFSRSINQQLSAGSTLKIIKSKIESYSANALALDVGLQYKFNSEIPMKSGIVLKNIGNKLKYQSVSENLPLYLKAGYNIEHYINEKFTLIPAIDFILSNSNDLSFNFGSELIILEEYFFRIGYDSLNDAGSGVSFGFGLELFEISFDYAFVPYSKLGNSHNISVMYKF